MSAAPSDRVEFLAFDPDLRSLLQIDPPFFLRSHPAPFRQLDYIGRYLEALGATSIVLEQKYIDRDFIEDHSLFYSRSLANYSNYCRRLHFFRKLPAKALRTRLEALSASASKMKGGAPESVLKEFRLSCAKFSNDHYLGFSVIKPLPGSPVGRTVLQHVANSPPDQGRSFPSARDYKTHLWGLELSVRGLAFQQQDEGVSACATTALWMSLQKFRDLEEISVATPAQITNLAVRNVLPYGRPLPQEGLSTDQMCQAIQAVGAAPLMLRPTSLGYTRQLILSTTASGMAPILILSRQAELHSQAPKHAHAVTVVGVRIESGEDCPGIRAGYSDLAGRLETLYLHDDRIGPYIRAKLGESQIEGFARPVIHYTESGIKDNWVLTHIIVPNHPKIRLSCDKAMEMALTIGARLRAISPIQIPLLSLQILVLRASTYIETLVVPRDGLKPIRGEDLGRLLSRAHLSRYVAVIRFHAPELGSRPGAIDVLIDTTGTVRNAHCCGVISRYSDPSRQTPSLVKKLAKRLDQALAI